VRFVISFYIIKHTSWGRGGGGDDDDDDGDELTATVVVNAVCRRHWNRTAFCVALLRARRIGYRKKTQPPPPSTRNNKTRAPSIDVLHPSCVCVCVCVYLLSYIVYEINWPRGGRDAHFENLTATAAALATYIIIYYYNYYFLLEDNNILSTRAEPKLDEIFILCSGIDWGVQYYIVAVWWRYIVIFKRTVVHSYTKTMLSLL